VELCPHSPHMPPWPTEWQCLVLCIYGCILLLTPSPSAYYLQGVSFSFCTIHNVHLYIFINIQYVLPEHLHKTLNINIYVRNSQQNKVFKCLIERHVSTFLIGHCQAKPT
jgi:hypothetical protein